MKLKNIGTKHLPWLWEG